MTRSNQPDEQGLLGQGKIVATYPSGKKIDDYGRLFFRKLPGGSEEAIPMLEREGGAILIFDSRAIITVDGIIRYHPRAFGPLLGAWAQEWLDEHKEWAQVAGMASMQAPGAWPEGTRIRKRVFEKGDGHQVGDLGTVEGSVFADDDRYVYSILWDDNPKVPVACDAYKIERCE